DPLYKSAAEWGEPFDDLIVGMLRAADASGQMSTILHQLADLLDRSLELKRELLGAIMYPAIIACLIGISGIVLVTVLIPRLIEPLAGQMTLPWPTLVVMGFANFIINWWIWILVGFVLVLFAWKSWVAVPENRFWFDRFKLRVPLLGRLLRDVAVARFTRTLGTLTSAGLPILDGLKITRDTLGNAALAQAVDSVQEQVSSGKQLAEPLERSGLFPPLLVQVVNLGERSGKLEEMLLHSATAFDRQVNASLKIFTKALPPVLLIIMAGLACFVLAAILLPLLELQSLVK
ncbi:MAG: type II secretory pathway component PulF, partial [Phycisphaerales bacterium]